MARILGALNAGNAIGSLIKGAGPGTDPFYVLPTGNPISIVKSHPDNRRRHGRVRANETTCNLGRVVDVSASGMSVLAPWWRMLRPGRMVKVRVNSFGRQMNVKARVVRAQRMLLGPTDVGLAFEELTPKAAAHLAAIARGVASSTPYPLKRAI